MTRKRRNNSNADKSRGNQRTRHGSARRGSSQRDAGKHRTRPGNPGSVPTAPDDEASCLLLFNKPYMVLCQFTDDSGRDTLANYISRPGIYAAGRLDRDSEGLLLLTNNGILQHRISHPDFKLPKQYLVQVEGEISQTALRNLCKGVQLKDGVAAAASAERIDEPDWLWPRDPPVRFRKEIPTSWLQLTLTEGRNRQVRRMTAAIGFPTLRLVRSSIGHVSLAGLAPGACREIEPAELFGR